MIVHILPPSATFKAVSYNTDKIDSGKGELMKVANFGALQGLGQLRPEDYRGYLQAISSQNKRVSFPQFHAVISAKGKQYDKEALTDIATQWLEAMGYGDQPYLIVYHKDTANNHVHIVTTRIGRDGKKISSSFENIRAISNLNRIMGVDEKRSVNDDIKQALGYSFSTKAQFMLLLETKGYTLKENAGELSVIKFGINQGTVQLEQVQAIINKGQANTARKAQLKAIFHKYAAGYDSAGLQQILHQKFGIELVFHAKGGQAPYGYTIIDHAAKTVFKGGEVMALKTLLGKAESSNKAIDFKISRAEKKQRYYYASLLKAALFNYPDFVQGLQHLGLAIIQKDGAYVLADSEASIFLDCRDLLSEKTYVHLVQALEQQTYTAPVPAINLAHDVDDEATHGRRRRKQIRSR